jgi:hypothetical protein
LNVSAKFSSAAKVLSSGTVARNITGQMEVSEHGKRRRSISSP